MKRLLASSLVLGVLSVGGFVGCDKTETNKVDVKAQGPGGTTEVERTDKVKTTGNNPPVVEPTKP